MDNNISQWHDQEIIKQFEQNTNRQYQKDLSGICIKYELNELDVNDFLYNSFLTKKISLEGTSFLNLVKGYFKKINTHLLEIKIVLIIEQF
ncbi:hypothetical protein DMC14_001435 [Metamycoplasma phocicerebrale]|uniref:Uncharacterized protein n=2 Tax=Metamycoplasma phocicerebrale TaxID=142649 RepID=A0A3T0TU04_9BACT|nr:hypothetical protein DMC14_001435 [Metamycoplasma phocicerebrale]